MPVRLRNGVSPGAGTDVCRAPWEPASGIGGFPPGALRFDVSRMICIKGWSEKGTKRKKPSRFTVRA